MRSSLLAAALSFVLLMPSAHAENMQRPDDRVTFTLAAEGWVTTKTARVAVDVEAAASAADAGSMRAGMLKAVNGLASADWRLVSLSRGQDQTGLERWSARFESRLPETAIDNLNERARKTSKVGMQMSVAAIDFSPTLDETEAARSAIRTAIYKKAAEQLAALNAALPGRGYRIAVIDFNGAGVQPGAMPRLMRSQVAAAPADGKTEAESMERSEKITLAARVVLAAPPEGKH